MSLILINELHVDFKYDPTATADTDTYGTSRNGATGGQEV